MHYIRKQHNYTVAHELIDHRVYLYFSARSFIVYCLVLCWGQALFKTPHVTEQKLKNQKTLLPK